MTLSTLYGSCFKVVVWVSRQLSVHSLVSHHLSEIFKNELLIFDRGKHDDTLDAFWYANKGAYRPTHVEFSQKKERNRVIGSVVDWEVV